MSPDTVPLPRVRGLSLERTLPLLMAALLLLVVGVGFVATRREVLRSARFAAAERLKNVVRELAASAEMSVDNHAAKVRAGGGEPAIRLALTGGSVSDSLLAEAIERVVPTADSAREIELLGRDGATVWRRGDPMARAIAERAGAIPPRGDSARFGPFQASAGQVLYWIVSPVARGTRRIGWIAEQRVLATSPRIRRQFEVLIGPGAAVYLRNDTGSFWTTLGGSVAVPPTDSRNAGGVITRRRPERGGAGRLLTAEAPVRGTAWTLNIELPVRTATAVARASLWRLALLNLVLLVLAGGAAWALGRWLTRPLVELTEATAAVARGDHARVEYEGWRMHGGEVGRLAASFNRMAAEVSASRAELEQQVAEAHALGEELERANAELHESTLAAENARAAAEGANRAKSEFLAMMSHELRTPLNAIAGYTELLELEIHGPVTPAQREDLERIRRSQRTLLSLIDDVLSYARIEAGRVDYHFSDERIDDIMAGAETLVAPQMSAKGIAYEYRPAGPGVRVWTDRRKLGQIVLNLLSNAVKFTDRGGRIAATVALEGDDVLIRVTDTGCGIAPEKHASIFEPFTQAESGLTRLTGGTGLGLAISREFARAMGGDVLVERSLEGSGSTFVIRLPVRHAPTSASGTAPAREDAAAAPVRTAEG
ncbi:MAG TPA: ATP-binding protein [Gemmatimonadaceae bacterium]